MTRKKKWIAMILAGGKGTRLGKLTENTAKPALYFGGKWRIIDFTLSNCANSGIDTVGVLTQFKPQELNDYIANGRAWNLNRQNGGIHILPPYKRNDNENFYKGTANAVYQNLNFINKYQPEYVVILSGDHIYRMDYEEMLDFHIKNKADVSIAVIDVKKEEAHRFGIMNTDKNGQIYEFEEKPNSPKSTLASMGVYIFRADKLIKYLSEDEKDKSSQNDFGKNIIPKMIKAGERAFAFKFSGYWRDVGTVKSLFDANMDLFEKEIYSELSCNADSVYSHNEIYKPKFISHTAKLQRAIIADGSQIYGKIKKSIIFSNVTVEENSFVENSIVMPNCKIGKNCKIINAIIGANAIIEEGTSFGEKIKGEISVCAPNFRLSCKK